MTIFLFIGGEPVLLSSGIHSFPFKLGLPLGLPSTFLGKHGWVQYFCKVRNYSNLFWEIVSFNQLRFNKNVDA